MDKLKLHTPDFAAVNAAKLAELFPSCVTETQAADGTIKRAIDFDLLRQELSYDLVEGPQERYRLDWPGKREALALANAPISKTLRPCKEESVDFETTRNLYIEGDNLDALKLLQETYLNQVKMIYIDPPYNTGNDFIYDDDFSMSREEYEGSSGGVDEEGNAMFDEEKWKKNSNTNGRFHSDWLKNIYARLKLARNLLRDDGVILISIDDGEIANLRRVCDEIFGEANFVACLVWEKGRKNDAKLFSLGHDYMLVFAKSREYLKQKGTKWREAKPGAAEIQAEYLELKKQYGTSYESIEEGLRSFFKSLNRTHPSKKLSRYNKVDERGVWRDDNMSWPGGGGPDYEVLHPTTGKPCEVPPGGWRYSTKKKMNEMIGKGRVLFRDDHTEPPIRKTYLISSSEDDDDDGGPEDEDAGIQVAGTYFYRSALQASNLMDEVFGAKVFDSPKDHEVIARWMKYVGTSENDIVLDFYSGSATTAHAAFAQNAAEGRGIRWILVQLPEVIDPDRITGARAKQTAKNAVKLLGQIGVPSTIAEIGKERARRSGQNIRRALTEDLAALPKDSEELASVKARLERLDVGFRVLKIDSSNMSDVYYQPDQLTQDALALQVDNVKKGRKPEDLLFQVLLDWGVDLGLPITEETIEGKKVFFVDDNALAACFDTGLTEDFCKALAKREPLRAVFRDAGYASDATKINIEQIFKALSPHTELKTL